MTATSERAGASLGLRVLRGTFWITVSGWSSKILALITAPILTALVSPAHYGVAALATTLAGLGSQLGLLGVDSGYARYWAGRADREDVERFCWRFAVGGSLLGALGAFLIWRTVVEPRVEAPVGLAAVLALAVFVQCLKQMAQMRTRFRSEYGRVALSQLVTAVAGAAATVAMAALWRADAWALILGALIGAIASMPVLRMPRARTLVGSSALDREQRREILGLGIASAVSGLMFWIVSSSDRWFLAAFRSEHEVGLYAFAASLGTVGLAVVNSMVASWYPEVTRSQESGEPHLDHVLGRQWARLVVVQLVIWLAVAAAGGDAVRLLAHPTFHASAPFVPWIAAGVFLNGVASLANTGLWLTKTMRSAAYWWAGGALFDVVLNLVLVPRFGGLGAALAWTLSQALVAVGVFTSAQRAFAMRVPWLRLLLATALAVAVAVPLALPWSSSPFLSLLLKLPVGIAIAGVLVRLFVPRWAELLSTVTSYLSGRDRRATADRDGAEPD
jgi:O-antigen/teichoic acid export membrane protein